MKHVATMVITGRWEGALLSDQNGQSVPFSLHQSPIASATAATASSGTQVQIGDGQHDSARLLEAASHSLVALVEGNEAAFSDISGQWVMNARRRGNRLVGHWLRRNAHGDIVATGQLSAAKIATKANSE